MVKPGDTVRYLNAVGGGTVTRVDGKMAYVDDNGFETPVLVKDLVAVAPAGHQTASGARLMFDQAAYDAARNAHNEQKNKIEKQQQQAAPAPRAAETDYGDALSIALAFEPSSTTRLSEATFNAVLVNDSNYYLAFCFSRRAADDREWTAVYEGTVAPNELIDLAQYSHEELPGLERVALQAIAFKRGKGFGLKDPVNAVRKLDLTKFHKLHCFRPGIYFDTPVLEVQLVKGDTPQRCDEGSRRDAVPAAAPKKKEKKGSQNPESNPRKLLPLIELDLHIDQLIETTAGMDAADILAYQVDTARRELRRHSRRIGQKIVLIHGKGDGVLRKAVLQMVRKEFPKAEVQDASFREYGFGASLITIH